MDELKDNRTAEIKELVKRYLKKKYPDAQFSDADLEFLARYSVKKNQAQILFLNRLAPIFKRSKHIMMLIRL